LAHGERQSQPLTLYAGAGAVKKGQNLDITSCKKNEIHQSLGGDGRLGNIGLKESPNQKKAVCLNLWGRIRECRFLLEKRETCLGQGGTRARAEKKSRGYTSTSTPPSKMYGMASAEFPTKERGGALEIRSLKKSRRRAEGSDSGELFLFQATYKGRKKNPHPTGKNRVRKGQKEKTKLKKVDSQTTKEKVGGNLGWRKEKKQRKKKNHGPKKRGRGPSHPIGKRIEGKEGIPAHRGK